MANNTFTILIIDDLQDNLITLNALIKDVFPEASVLKARKGKTGLELAAKENPDVILLDILMPDMDGYEVCKKLKADKELCDIPVVFVTALENNKEALVKALDSGGEAFLTKPIDEIELTAQIRAMLKIRQANEAKKNEKVRLEKLVEKRSKELVQELAARTQAEEELKESEATVRRKLKAMLEPEGDIASLELSDIIDTEMLQSIMDDFYGLTGMLGAVLDVSGKVLVAAGWQDICTKFHRCHPDTLKNCFESDTVLSNGVAEGEFKAYRCKNNMWDIVTPIMIGGKHFGNVFMGQYFLEDEELDIELFRRQAKKYGFDEQEYLAALDRVPRFNKKTVEKGMQFYSKFAKLISTLSYSSIQQSRMLTQQKRVEADLLKAKEHAEKSEEKFRGIYEQSPIVIEIYDKHGKLIDVNQQTLDMFGVDDKKHVLGFDLWDDPNLSAEKMKLLKSGHEIFLSSEFDFEIVKKNKLYPTSRSGKIYMDMYAIPLLNDNEVTGYLVQIVETTDRKQAEEKLKESEEKFRTLVNNIPGVTYRCEYESDWTMLFISNQIKSLSGYPATDFVLNKTRSYASIIHADDRKRVRSIVFNSIEKKEPYQLEYRICHANEEIRWIYENGQAVFDKNGVVSYLDGVLVDITERKQAEEALKDHHQYLQKLNDSLSSVVFKVNIQTRLIEYVNKRVEAIFGYRPDECIGNTTRFLYPNNEAFVTYGQQMRKSVQDKQDFLLTESVLRRKNGETFYTEITTAFLSKTEVVAVISDITERKKAEKELSKLSTAVNQSPSVIAITDPKGKLEYVNPQFTESTGYSMAEAIGQNPRVLKSGEQSDEMYKELWKTISSGKIWRGEFHNKKKNGELFWEIASVSPILDEQGKIINYIKVAEDITERKQAEENFRHSIDESPLGIRIVNEAGKTIYVNRALLDIYEFATADEFLKSRVKERYIEKSYQEHQERKKIRQKGGDAYDYEISVRRKNGEIRHIKVWRKEVIWNREKHFQIINEDITDIRRLNEELILAKEKAVESNRLKTAFLNNMSHEIRTPLNGITGFIGLLQDSEIDDEQKQHYFDIINKSSDRLIATVTDILDVSRIEAGLVNVSETEVSVNDILEEQFKFFYQEAKSKGLELIYKTGFSDKEARFVTDKYKLEGILTNLIKNAIKFTEKGEITFACSLQKQDMEVLEFQVKDTGIGIPANRIDAIFNRFEQADIEDTRVHQGSGLGLAIAKSYVEMLGGEITVNSEVGSGSIFTFSIPYTKQLVKEPDTKGNVTKEMQTELSNLSVIIAEDDEASIMYLDAIFKNEFNNITYAKTGKETIDKCRENPETDLILMDIKMPGMNGYDATREIRKFNSNVIIIAQTAFVLAGDKEKAIEAGCNDYIVKPTKKDKLVALIQKYFNKL